MGEVPARANAAKIAASMMITMAIEALAEGVVLTEANGLPREAFFELVLGTLFGSRAYETYSGHIAAGSYEPGFKASLGLKDLRLATMAAEAAGHRLPMLDTVRERMGEAVTAGLGDKDWSIMADSPSTRGGTPDGAVLFQGRSRRCADRLRLFSRLARSHLTCSAFSARPSLSPELAAALVPPARAASR